MSQGHAQGELLGRVVPGVTTPVTLFTAGELRTEVTLFIIAFGPLGGGSSTTIVIYHDDEGTTYDGTTAIAGGIVNKDTQLLTTVFQAQHPGSGIMIKPGGSLGVSTTDVDECVFTVYGVTATVAERMRMSG